MKKTGFYFLLLLVFAGCDQKVDWPLQAQPNKFLVVEGLITDELKTQSVRITRPVSTINEKPSGVSGAEVMVSGNNKVYHFTEDSREPGKYLSDIPFEGKVGKEYSLLITVAGVVYSAKDIMPPGFVNFITAKYIRSKAPGLYHINWVSNSYDPRRPSMIEVLLDWSGVPGYEAADSATTHARLIYYSLPTLDVSEVLSPDAQEIDFPLGTQITERRYSITFEYAAFLRAMLSETSWQGGLFNSASSNVPTNLSSGAYGYFGASAVLEKKGVVE